MSILQNKSEVSLAATKMNKSSAVRMKKRNVKFRYEKPRIRIYSKEGKDFWCD